MASTNQEQYLLELINDARLNPLGDAAKYIVSYNPLTSSQQNIQSALSYFGVSGPTLQQAYSALAPAQPLAWNESLASTARQHNQAMISADSQSHQLPGEPDFGTRIKQAGYTFTAAGENIFAYAGDPLFAHAGFMVDWGNSTSGHRDNIMNPAYREVGIGITQNTNSDPSFGPLVVTEDFGTRGAAGTILLGTSYNDSDHDDFYSIGEGVSGLSVSVAGAGTSSSSSGGYSLQTDATGVQSVTLSGAGLSGPVQVALDLEPGRNIKLDVVDGHTLRTSSSATVEGPISRIESLGVQGLTITAGSGSQTITGTVGSDTFSGGLDNDIVYGNQGTDVIYGNQGTDTLFGGQGDDVAYGGKDADAVYGNLGNDAIYGNLGDDLLFGGQGDDRLFGGQSNDTLSGNLGNDTLSGGLGADRFVFGQNSGADLILGFSQADGDLLDLQGQSYTVKAAPDGSAMLSLSGGGNIDLAGLTPGQVSGAMFANYPS